MDEQEAFRNYLQVQMNLIDIDKWNEGMRLHKDPGEEFVREWVEKHAKEFHIKWNKSVCHNCKYQLDCGWELLEQCDKFEQM